MKNKIYFILAAMLMVQCAIAQDTTFLSEYFKLIKTYNTLDEVYQAHPELKPAPPKIVINENEVLFYNDKRAIVNRMPVVIEEAIPVDDPKFEEYGSSKKIIRNYKVIDDELLGVWESYGYWDGIHVLAKQAMVYDANGNLITYIKKWHDNIKLSPDKQKFLTYYSGEGGGDTVFVYNLDGELILNKYFLCENSRIDFTNNSNFLKTRNVYVGIISIVNFNGENIFELNYQSRINKPLYDYIFLDEIENVLISTFLESDQIFLFDLNSNLIWKHKMNRCIFCTLIREENAILFITIDKKSENDTRPGTIQLVDLSDAERLTNVSYDEIVYYSKAILIFKQSEVYYEYNY
ncbi:MAG: hypothetical protein WC271_15510 [Bacteroidales bacterium]|jgi:hypothetical protein|nr:hypothetical protein [Bacteroidales bacterium]